jgi:glycosyltransferase involved in cell wall biosynthesis
MNLSDLLTIVIPCKNEKEIISKTLDLLNHQTNIRGVQVIVCDSSDDGYTSLVLREKSEFSLDEYNFKLTITNGGLPSRARNNGFKMVKTPYVLFMDADIFLLDSEILKNVVSKIKNENLDLVSVRFRTDNGDYNYVYKVFDVLQKLSMLISPFCLGGFMLTKSSKFKEIGGFDEEVKVAEDYVYSKQINSNKFKIHNAFVYTPPRRFHNKGLWYMTKLMIGSVLNKNNKEYFKDSKSYWS